MRLHQISAKYDPYEDRIKLSINTLEGQQLGLWLTQRFMLRWWPQLQQHEHFLAQSGSKEAEAGTQGHSPEAKDMIAELRRESALKKADFASPYKAMEEVEGHGDLLITKLDMSHKRTEQGHVQTHFHFQQARPHETERGIQFDLAPDACFGLFAVLRQALDRSGWLSAAATVPSVANAGPSAEGGGDLHIL